MRSFLFLSLFFLFLAASPINAKSTVIPLDKIIAIVDDNIITKVELDERVNTISQQLIKQGNRPPTNSSFRKQVLERLILETLQLEMAKNTGIRINDEMLNNVIANIAKDNNLSIPLFREALEKEGYVFAKFRENIRREITISRLRKVRIENKVNVSDQEIDNYLNQYLKGNLTDEEYHLAHILIATPEAATPQQIEEAKIKAQKVLSDLQKGADFSQTAITVSTDELALKGGDLGWRKIAQLPTFFAALVSKMKKNEIKGLLNSARGFHIIKLLDKRTNSKKHIIKQTLARHILIRPTQVLTREEARLRIEVILQHIKEGKDFASLARASSNDTVSAAEGGSLGWVSSGMMVLAFENEMNKLKLGEISDPFMTQYGWHIVQVLSRRKHDSTEQFQRSQAIKLIRKRKTEEAIQDWMRQLRAEAYVEYLSNK